MYFRQSFNLKEQDDTVDYIVIDDFHKDQDKYWPTWKMFVGAQDDFTLTDKYMLK